MENRQYFTKDNNKLPSNKTLIKAYIKDMPFSYYTDNGVFSKEYLDYATKLLLENMVLDTPSGVALDLGCGYGPVGIFLNKYYGLEVVMVDVNERALELAKENLSLNGANGEVLYSDSFESIDDRSFSTILLNPPIHAGKEVIYKMFNEAYNHLIFEGALYVVIQEKHGAPSASKKLKEIFEKVEIFYKKKGFYLIKCTKLA